MKILMTGLSEPSAKAIEMLIASVMPGAAVTQMAATQALLPSVAHSNGASADLCIVDVNGLGLAQWSTERQDLLQALVLKDSRTLVLAPAGSGGGWLNATLPHHLVLQQPVSATAMRSALTALRDGNLPTPAAAAAPSAASPSRAAAVPQGLTPTESACAALRAVCPAATDNAYLKLLLDMALKPTPHEFEIGKQSGCVMLPAEGWVASNIATAMRERLTQHPVMLGIVKITPLSPEDVLPRAERLYGRRQDGRRPLDTFLWSLVYHTCASTPLPVTGDLHFQLQRFPNFTRLPAMPDLFIQLAMLCLRGPQSIKGLEQTFPRHDPQQIALFVACAVLSGSATILSDPAAQKAPRPAPEVQRNAPAPRGFLRSLLSKLF